MVFFCYAGCTTCQRAKAFLEEHGVPFTIRDIKAENPSKEELRRLWQVSGLPLGRFFNTSGLLYRSMGLKDRLPSMTEEDMLSLLATDGMLVKRPILAGAGFVLVGFREAQWAAVVER